jgi:hypothetical protein
MKVEVPDAIEFDADMSSTTYREMVEGA